MSAPRDGRNLRWFCHVFNHVLVQLQPVGPRRGNTAQLFMIVRYIRQKRLALC
jgi:hypothetical protein